MLSAKLRPFHLVLKVLTLWKTRNPGTITWQRHCCYVVWTVLMMTLSCVGCMGSLLCLWPAVGETNSLSERWWSKSYPIMGTSKEFSISLNRFSEWLTSTPSAVVKSFSRPSQVPQSPVSRPSPAYLQGKSTTPSLRGPCRKNPILMSHFSLSNLT